MAGNISMCGADLGPGAGNGAITSQVPRGLTRKGHHWIRLIFAHRMVPLFTGLGIICVTGISATSGEYIVENESTVTLRAQLFQARVLYG